MTSLNCIKCGRRPVCTVFARIVFGFHSLPSDLFHGDVVDISGTAWDEIFTQIAGCCKKFIEGGPGLNASSCLTCENEVLCHYWIKIKDQANGGVDKIVSYARMDAFIHDMAFVVCKHCRESRYKGLVKK